MNRIRTILKILITLVIVTVVAGQSKPKKMTKQERKDAKEWGWLDNMYIKYDVPDSGKRVKTEKKNEYYKDLSKEQLQQMSKMDSILIKLDSVKNKKK